MKDTVSTLISGMSSSPTAQGVVEKQAKPSPASPSTVVKEKAEAGTLREKWDDVSHFRESLESRCIGRSLCPMTKYRIF